MTNFGIFTDDEQIIRVIDVRNWMEGRCAENCFSGGKFIGAVLGAGAESSAQADFPGK